MTKFMLDTDACIDLIRRRNAHLLANLLRRQAEDICISSVTLSELEYGAAKSSNPNRNRLALAAFIAPITVHPYGEHAAYSYGLLRAGLERAGTPIGPLDTMIAAHALSLSQTIVTNNEQEFRRVSGLKVENWAKGERQR